MQAVVYKGPFTVAVEEVPDARIEAPGDAVPLTEAPAAYEKFDRREDGYTKVLLHPANS